MTRPSVAVFLFPRLHLLLYCVPTCMPGFCRFPLYVPAQPTRDGLRERFPLCVSPILPSLARRRTRAVDGRPQAAERPRPGLLSDHGSAETAE